MTVNITGKITNDYKIILTYECIFPAYDKLI